MARRVSFVREGRSRSLHRTGRVRTAGRDRFVQFPRQEGIVPVPSPEDVSREQPRASVSAVFRGKRRTARRGRAGAGSILPQRSVGRGRHRARAWVGLYCTGSASGRAEPKRCHLDQVIGSARIENGKSNTSILFYSVLHCIVPLVQWHRSSAILCQWLL